MSGQKSGGEQERMDCAEFRDLLHELDRPGTRGADASGSALMHAEGCSDCGVLLVEEESLDFALQSIAREAGRMPGAARVEAVLRKEFNKAKSEVVVAGAVVRDRVRWQVAALAVAAVLLLVVGGILYQRNFGTGAGEHAGVTAVVANLPARTETGAKSSDTTSEIPVETARENTSAAVAAGNASATATQAGSGASESGTAEYATDYVRLPYADDPASLEGGSVVRVTLARAALESYGLPAEGMGTGDRVTADLLVSEDGTPEAIRLVAQED